MQWTQKEIVLPSFPRGYHIITDLILNEIDGLKETNIGIAYIFIKHTSASLTVKDTIRSL